MKTKHTPGPWRVVDFRKLPCGHLTPLGIRADDTSVYKGEGKVKIADMLSYNMNPIYTPSADEIEANAKLMAAAPEQHDAHLKNVKLLEDFDFNNYLRLGSNTQEKLNKCIEIINKILVNSQEAIKKATL